MNALPANLRSDLAAIVQHVPRGARVLDIGCGDGTLMAALRDKRGVDARGMEISPEKVQLCVAKGLSAIQGDANRDLEYYPDGSFDVAILSQTLQTAEHPDKMLDELLRIGRDAFVSFPNFAYWRMRFSLLVHGRMPITRHLPVSWYETENIHQLTIADFYALLDYKGVKIERSWFFTHDREIGPTYANWRAEYAVFQLSR